MISDPQDRLQQQLEEKMREIQLQGEEERAKQTAKKLKLPYINLKIFPISAGVLNIVEEGRSRAGQLAIISKSGSGLKVAVRDPGNAETQVVLEELKSRKFSLSLAISSLQGLEAAWKHYEVSKKIERAEMGMVALTEEQISRLQENIKNVSDLKNSLSKLRVTDIIDILIAGALKIEASDIHMEPEEERLRIRYRIDGILADIAELPNKEYPQLLSRIKLISKLKINIHDIPQDGRFTIRLKNKDVEVRTSVLPGAYGESAVLRILDPETILQNLEKLGMRKGILETIKKELKRTTGAILTTGPTGSGKTTTLYSFLQFINEKGIKIITIEDPIEYHIGGISQTQVNERKGYTFAGGLRSIVRQDPDVILVGEIRDVETAEIAMQAALTGHLVLSTLHTNDAAGAIPRLIDLGVRPVTIAPAINAVMAQRLVRKLCQKCKKKKKIALSDLKILKSALENLPKSFSIPRLSADVEIFYPQTCQACNMTGYKGRVGIFELFLVDDEMERFIISSPSISDIRELALKKGMLTMLEDGYLKVLDGLSSMEEIQRVATL